MDGLTGKVYASAPGPSDEQVQVARDLGVANIAAAVADPWGRDMLTDQVLRRVAGTGVVAGRAVTVWNPPGNNTMVRFGIEACEPGDVLVVTTPTDGAAQWGDLAHEWARALGLAGVVVDGSVRDVEQVRSMGLSLWARSVNPRQALKQALGYVNAPIQVAGTRVTPGDLVVADDDAVAAVPAARAAEVLELAQAREERERQSRLDLSQGRVSEHLSQTFDASGIERIGQPWSD